MHAQRTITDPAPLLRIEQIEFTHHVLTQAANKGFTKAQIVDALTRPYKVTDVTAYPGQRRWCGRGPKMADGTYLPGIAVVLAPLGGGRWQAITAYLDGVRTPLRQDQLNDPRALASTRVGNR
jgi:hypothetical protein